MDLQIKDQLFIVGGATSGFGRAIALSLLEEGARIIAVARTEAKLQQLRADFPDRVQVIAADITEEGTVEKIVTLIGRNVLHGIVLNAGGPPAMTALETKMSDWDDAYKKVLRWKIEICQQLVPMMKISNYGRVVSIESASVKQPMENLVLSTSMRLAFIGFLKTISQEESKYGITFNALAPGFHETAAMERLISKKIEQTGTSRKEIVDQYKAETRVGFLGSATDFASLATWLLSPHSRFITGQTITVDGGVIRGIMG